MKRILALACAGLLSACSSGADVADDTPARDSTVEAITDRPRSAGEKVQRRLDQAREDAGARAADAGADEPR